MRADDPRHGSERGHEQHLRDGEDPCDECRHGDLIAARRRGKRKSMGYQYQRPLGHLYWKLQALHKAGATYDDLTAWSSVVNSQVWRALNGSPEALVYARTWHKFQAMQPGRIITPIGVTRRIQGLMWLGYSAIVIADEAGCHVDSIRASRDQPREFVARKFKVGVADAFDRLHMTIPVGATKQHGAGISRMRNLARKHGWAPPMAWESIDQDAAPAEDERAGNWEEVVDAAIVERVLTTGIRPRQLTRAEAAEITHTLLARGLSTWRIRNDYGLKPERYKEVAA